MRVTRVIREYVESEVHLKFDAARKVVNDEYDNAIHPVAQAIREIAEEANKRAVEIAEKSGLYHKHCGALIRDCSHNLAHIELRHDRDRKLMDIRMREAKAVNDIIIGLELGETTKNDLRAAIDAVVA